MKQRDAMYHALQDAAANIDGSRELIEQRYHGTSEQDRAKLLKAYEKVADQLRARAARYCHEHK